MGEVVNYPDDASKCLASNSTKDLEEHDTVLSNSEASEIKSRKKNKREKTRQGKQKKLPSDDALASTVDIPGSSAKDAPMDVSDQVPASVYTEDLMEEMVSVKESPLLVKENVLTPVKGSASKNKDKEIVKHTSGTAQCFASNSTKDLEDHAKVDSNSEANEITSLKRKKRIRNREGKQKKLSSDGALATTVDIPGTSAEDDPLDVLNEVPTSVFTEEYVVGEVISVNDPPLLVKENVILPVKKSTSKDKDKEIVKHTNDVGKCLPANSTRVLEDHAKVDSNSEAREMKSLKRDKRVKTRQGKLNFFSSDGALGSIVNIPGTSAKYAPMDISDQVSTYTYNEELMEKVVSSDVGKCLAANSTKDLEDQAMVNNNSEAGELKSLKRKKQGKSCQDKQKKLPSDGAVASTVDIPGTSAKDDPMNVSDQVLTPAYNDPPLLVKENVLPPVIKFAPSDKDKKIVAESFKKSTVNEVLSDASLIDMPEKHSGQYDKDKLDVESGTLKLESKPHYGPTISSELSESSDDDDDISLLDIRINAHLPPPLGVDTRNLEKDVKESVFPQVKQSTSRDKDKKIVKHTNDAGKCLPANSTRVLEDHAKVDSNSEASEMKSLKRENRVKTRQGKQKELSSAGALALIVDIPGTSAKDSPMDISDQVSTYPYKEDLIEKVVSSDVGKCLAANSTKDLEDHAMVNNNSEAGELESLKRKKREKSCQGKQKEISSDGALALMIDIPGTRAKDSPMDISDQVSTYPYKEDPIEEVVSSDVGTCLAANSAKDLEDHATVNNNSEAGELKSLKRKKREKSCQDKQKKLPSDGAVASTVDIPGTSAKDDPMNVSDQVLTPAYNDPPLLVKENVLPPVIKSTSRDKDKKIVAESFKKSTVNEVLSDASLIDMPEKHSGQYDKDKLDVESGKLKLESKPHYGPAISSELSESSDDDDISQLDIRINAHLPPPLGVDTHNLEKDVKESVFPQVKQSTSRDKDKKIVKHTNDAGKCLPANSARVLEDHDKVGSNSDAREMKSLKREKRVKTRQGKQKELSSAGALALIVDIPGTSAKDSPMDISDQVSTYPYKEDLIEKVVSSDVGKCLAANSTKDLEDHAMVNNNSEAGELKSLKRKKREKSCQGKQKEISSDGALALMIDIPGTRAKDSPMDILDQVSTYPYKEDLIEEVVSSDVGKCLAANSAKDLEDHATVNNNSEAGELKSLKRKKREKSCQDKQKKLPSDGAVASTVDIPGTSAKDDPMNVSDQVLTPAYNDPPLLVKENVLPPVIKSASRDKDKKIVAESFKKSTVNEVLSDASLIDMPEKHSGQYDKDKLDVERGTLKLESKPHYGPTISSELSESSDDDDISQLDIRINAHLPPPLGVDTRNLEKDVIESVFPQVKQSTSRDKDKKIVKHTNDAGKCLPANSTRVLEDQAKVDSNSEAREMKSLKREKRVKTRQGKKKELSSAGALALIVDIPGTSAKDSPMDISDQVSTYPYKEDLIEKVVSSDVGKCLAANSTKDLEDHATVNNNSEAGELKSLKRKKREKSCQGKQKKLSSDGDVASTVDIPGTSAKDDPMMNVSDQVFTPAYTEELMAEVIYANDPPLLVKENGLPPVIESASRDKDKKIVAESLKHSTVENDVPYGASLKDTPEKHHGQYNKDKLDIESVTLKLKSKPQNGPTISSELSESSDDDDISQFDFGTNVHLPPPLGVDTRNLEKDVDGRLPVGPSSSTELEMTHETIHDVSQLDIGKKCPIPAPLEVLPYSSKKNLLVLDLNGLLTDIVYPVPRNYKRDAMISGKAAFKRPFCDDFLRFCFENFHVGVWSSRAKKNVKLALDFLMGSLQRKLCFCWDRSQCTDTGFNTLENGVKPMVLKELTKLWEKHGQDLPWKKGDYNESNTLLLDDSPYKALRNPPYTGIFPKPYCYKDEFDNSLGPGGDLRVYLEGIASADDVQKYVEANPFGQPAITNENANWNFYLKVIRDTSLPTGKNNNPQSANKHTYF